MPQKGFITQCLCVLLQKTPEIEQVAAQLSGFEILGQAPAKADWPFGGPTVTLAYRPEVNGRVLVDIVNRAWPDAMGENMTELSVFGAWGMGQFGPATWPRGLSRACDQNWSWEDAAATVKRHQAFVRVRSTYVHGAGENAPIFPDDYNALHELRFVTDVAHSLMNLPGTLCFFNPGGELVMNRESLEEHLQWARTNNLPALEAWSNVRLFRINETWLTMDTVGNSLLDLPDLEACFCEDRYECSEIDHFLRNLTLFLLRSGSEVNDGDTVDGPGRVQWRIERMEEGLTPPPRPLLRLVPDDGEPLPAALVGTADEG